MVRYLVTKEELDYIKNDCVHPETDGCPDDCEYIDVDIGCSRCPNVLMDEVLSRTPYPDEGILYTEKQAKMLVEAGQHEILNKILDEFKRIINGGKRK